MASDAHAAEDEIDDEPDESAGREPDYYALLGVRPDATADEIHHAFRRLAMLWHPDRFASAPPIMRERAERRMRAVIRARDVLANPISRHEYDRCRDPRHASEPTLGPDARPFHMPNTPPPFFGAGTMAHYERHSSNTNGAGQFLGALALVLALGLAASAFKGRFGSSTGSFIAFALILGLFLLSAYLFSDGSALDRAATHILEADPAPRRPRRAPPRAGARRSGRHRSAKSRTHHGMATRRGTRRGPSGHERAENTTSSDEPEEPVTSEHDQEKPGDRAFDALVRQALAGVPDEFQTWLDNVVVQVVREPAKKQLHELHIRPDCTLLGLYQGVSLPHQYHFTGHGAPPEIITIFQGPIERYAGHDPERVKEQVRRTVLHEIAHHFGMSHEDMPAWIR